MIGLIYKIRNYQTGDKDELIKLYNEFGEYFIKIDGLKLTAKYDNYADFYFSQLINDTTKQPGNIFVVEAENGKLIGFAAGNVHELTPETDPSSVPITKGRILELFVQEKHRGQGIGKELMKELEKFFIENGCKIINVEVFAPNQSAYNFYKNLGYIDRNYDLIKIV